MKRRILFIAPIFFNYYKKIIEALEKEGYEVDYIQDIPNSSNMYKAVSRVKRNWTKFIVEKYFNSKIVPLISTKKYNYVLVIVGMTFSFFPEMFEKIKKQQKNAKFIMYQWDGEDNIKYILDFHKYFDKVYTFDRQDTLKNKKYNFLPLFYIDEYKEIGKSKLKHFDYDISYIGTAHPQKIKDITKMSNELKEVYKKQYIYNYMPSKLKYYYHKLTAKEYKNIKIENLEFEKIPYDKTMEIFKKSKCILDAPQKGQNGLTIRTIECLGAKRKLITTNKDIINYDFYLPENIYVYDGKFNYNSIFFKTEYKEIDTNIYKKYSLSSWLKTLLK